MSIAQRLQLRQTQQLVMTPQLRQAISMLQMTHADLAAFVAEEAEKNPLLKVETGERETDTPVAAETPDIDNVGKTEDAFEASGENLYESAEAPQPSLSSPAASPAVGEDFTDFTERMSQAISRRDHLNAQISLAPGRIRARSLATLLVDELDEAGYLRISRAEIETRFGASPDLVEEAVSILQTCEPTGVGAANLAECLALQLIERDRFDPAMQALVAHLDDLAAGRIDQLLKICGVDQADLRDMIGEIRALDPRPGAGFDTTTAQTVIPDIFVRRTAHGGWAVEVNSDALPKVLIDKSYAVELSRRGETEKSTFLADCRQSANWLVRALDQRAQTILKVGAEVVKQQHAFFDEGVAALRPMTLRMVADEIGMHESTVSRVTANKYMATDSGLYELKFFFTQAIGGAGGGDSHSSEAVRHQIKSLIEKEDPKKTLSDDKLVKMLRADGVDIARRTVAKYREGMNIPSSVQRRRLKAAALD